MAIPLRETTLSDLTNAAMEHISEEHAPLHRPSSLPTTSVSPLSAPTYRVHGSWSSLSSGGSNCDVKQRELAHAGVPNRGQQAT